MSGRRANGDGGSAPPRRPDPAAIRSALRAYGLLVSLLPAAVRRRRAEMTAVFHRLAADAHASGGWPLVIAVLLSEARDVLGTAAAARGREAVRSTTGLGRDFRFAFRRLRRKPGFAAVAISSLGLVIGGNSAVFGLVHAVLLREPPLERSRELVDVFYQQQELPFGTLSHADASDLREASADVFAGVLTSRYSYAPWERQDGVRVLPTELVSGDYFSLQGLRPAVGRLLTPEDDVSPGAHPVVVLGHSFWRRTFDADPRVVGRTLRLGGRDYTVVGVAPEEWQGFVRGLVPDLYIPVRMINVLLPLGFDALEARGNYATFVRARLAQGVTLEQARAAVAAFTRDMRAAQPDYWTDQNRIRLVPTDDVVVNPGIDRFIVAAGIALLAAVLLLLVVACANLASFLLAQGADRRREVAVRLALGAGRGSLARQILTETLLVALFGGALGLLLATRGTRALMALDLPLPLPLSLDLRPDGVVLAWTAGVMGLSGLLFGILPAVQSTRTPVAPTLRDESAGGGGPGRASLRGALVVAQVAVSLVCLVAAGLFLRDLLAARGLDAGFGYRPAALVTLVLPPAIHADGRVPVVLEELRRRLAEVPEVEGVGLASTLQLDMTNSDWVEVEVPGIEPPADRRGFVVYTSSVTSGFFEAAGIRLLRGRLFDGRDTPGSGTTAVVSQAMAERFWPGVDPLGRTFLADGEEATVVGVAADTKVRSLGEEPRPYLYRSLSQEFSSVLTVVAATRGAAAGALPRLTRALAGVNPDIRVVKTGTMRDHLDILLLPSRLAATAFGALATLALLLALVGLYGVVSYAVARRSREMGIRMSLGAAPRSVVALMLGSGLRLVSIGCAVGLALAVVVGLGLRSLLFQVGALDPVTFIGVPLLFLLVGALAAWVPARRAGRMDPAAALRSD